MTNTFLMVPIRFNSSSLNWQESVLSQTRLEKTPRSFRRTGTWGSGMRAQAPFCRAPAAFFKSIPNTDRQPRENGGTALSPLERRRRNVRPKKGNPNAPRGRLLRRGVLPLWGTETSILYSTPVKFVNSFPKTSQRTFIQFSSGLFLGGYL